MSKFFKTALSNFSNLFQTNDNNTTINTSAYTIPPMQQENDVNEPDSETVDLNSYLNSENNNRIESNNNKESPTIIENLSSKISEIGDTIDSGIVDLGKGIDNKASWVAKKT